MKSYTPDNPPKSGKGKRIWDYLTQCGAKMKELHYNSNCWGKGATDGYGTWAGTAENLGPSEGFWCGEDEGGIYVMGMGVPYNKVYVKPEKSGTI